MGAVRVRWAWIRRIFCRDRGMRRGQALVLVLIAIPCVMGMAALSVTVGTVYVARSNLQNAVDAAALAGAQEMTSGDSSAPGDQSYVIAQNDGSAEHGCVSTLPSSCGLTLSAIPSTVVATATESVPGTFASLFGIKHFTVRAVAVASYGPGAPFDYAVFQGDSNPADSPLSLNGNDQIGLASGATGQASIHSNNAARVVGNVQVQGACTAADGVTLTGNVGCGSVDDSSPDIPMPNYTTLAVTAPPATTTIGSSSNPVGYSFSGNTTLTGNWLVYGNVTLSGNVSGPGTLVVYGNVTITGNVAGPATLVVHGAVNLAGNLNGQTDVYAYGTVTVSGNSSGTGSITAIGGGITLNGNVSMTPGSTGVGLALTALPPPNSPTTTEDITINGNDTVYGAVYAPAGTITMNGNDNVYGAVVGNRVRLNGNNDVYYDPGQLSEVPFAQVALVR